MVDTGIVSSNNMNTIFFKYYVTFSNMTIYSGSLYRSDTILARDFVIDFDMLTEFQEVYIEHVHRV